MASPGKCPVFLAFGSLALASVAEISNPGSGVFLASTCTWLSGMVGNPVQNWINRLFPKPAPDTGEIFQNHDVLKLLQSAIRHACEKTCDDYHKKIGNAPDRLRAAGEFLAGEMETAIEAPHHPLASLREFDITTLLDSFVKNEGNVSLLTAKEWLPAIALVPELTVEERNALAKGLATRFGPSLWGCTKHDAEQNGKAFTAIQLTFLSEIKQLLLEGKHTPLPGLDLDAITTRIDPSARKTPQVTAPATRSSTKCWRIRSSI